MKNGVFTLSLDCEGLWGVADHLNESTKIINQSNLAEVYSYISDVLSYYSISATYAFTSLFTQDEAGILKFKENIDNRVSSEDRWYRYISKMLSDQNFDGWIGRDFYLQARSCGHEIGWHGFTHHPLSTATDSSIIKFELEESLKIAKQENINLESVVFPRNAIGHLDLVSEGGFKCYRKGVIEQSRMYSNKYYRVLDELNIFKASEAFPVINKKSISALPAGYFLNWPSGPRKFIPTIVTNRRWFNILTSATKKQGQVHMWFHPHNMITAPKMRDSFEFIIKKASEKVAKGDLLNLTMNEFSEYCK